MIDDTRAGSPEREYLHTNTNINSVNNSENNAVTGSKRKKSRTEYKKQTDYANVFDREMPQNRLFEETILGLCLSNVTAFDKVNEFLSNEDFYNTENKILYNVFLELNKRGAKIELTSVTSYINEKKLYTEISPVYVSQLTMNGFTTANLQYYIDELRRCTVTRSLIIKALNTIKDAFDGEDIYALYDTLNSATRINSPKRLVRVMSMNEALKEGSKEKPRKKIFGSLIREGDVTIMYGDEGTGKSIVGFQMGHAASKGEALFGEADFANEAGPQKTLVFDFELETRELFDRYSEGGLPYEFSENLFRADINPDCLDLDNSDVKLMKAVEIAIDQAQPQFVIVDNLTWITSESQDTKIASDFMKKLLGMQRKHGLTILVIAHTPKRNTSEPIESKHLAGSSNLKNFAKNLIAVSPSKLDPNIRYIKHVKSRNTAKEFGADNVIQCAVDKHPGSALLEFKYMKTTPEALHLATPQLEMSEDEICSRAVKMKDNGETWQDIIDALNLSWHRTTLMRKVEKYEQKHLKKEDTDKTETLSEEKQQNADWLDGL